MTFTLERAEELIADLEARKTTLHPRSAAGTHLIGRRWPIALAALPGLSVPGNTIMAKRIRRSHMWSMKTDRELIALSKTKPIEALVDPLPAAA
jgi:hypothetical protein